jgi:hypothetical protein
MKQFSIRTPWLGTWLFLLAWASPSSAQTPLDIHVRHVNDFASGYDASAHEYRPEWVKDTIAEPRVRRAEAQGCSSFPLQSFPQIRTDDGNQQCGDLRIRVAPAGVSTLRWSVTPTHSIANILKTKTIQLQQYKHPFNQVCAPTARPLVPKPEDCLFSADLPIALHTDSPLSYSFRLEGLNNANEVKASGSRSVSIPRRVPLIVSVGESMASGEGNPDRAGAAKGNECEVFTSLMMAREEKPEMHREPQWLDADDHRSLESGAAIAARLLLSEWPYIGFLSFAKSGSTVLDSERPLFDQLQQVSETVGSHPIDVLHMSIGGNDVEFATTLRALVTYTKFPVVGGLGTQPPRFLDLLEKLETSLYPLVDNVIQSLELNVRKVVINEYPGSLFNDKNNVPSPGCGVFKTVGEAFLSISSQDAKMINGAGILLNEAIARAAQQHGWQLVTGIARRFEGHGYCTPQSFWVFAEDSCDRQGDFEGTMHPNKRGTGIIAEALAREFRPFLPPPPGSPLVINFPAVLSVILD